MDLSYPEAEIDRWIDLLIIGSYSALANSKQRLKVTVQKQFIIIERKRKQNADGIACDSIVFMLDLVKEPLKLTCRRWKQMLDSIIIELS